MPIYKWQYHNGGAEFILERVDANTVKVTHLEQTGWFGLNADWDADQPYAWTTSERDIKNNGIDGIFRHATPTTPSKCCVTACLGTSGRLIPNASTRNRGRKLLEKFWTSFSGNSPNSRVV